MKRKLLLVTGLGVLYLLHNDVWNWDAPHRLEALWGLPAGFVWHVGYCLAAAGWMWAMVRGWPRGESLHSASHGASKPDSPLPGVRR